MVLAVWFGLSAMSDSSKLALRLSLVLLVDENACNGTLGRFSMSRSVVRAGAQTPFDRLYSVVTINSARLLRINKYVVVRSQATPI